MKLATRWIEWVLSVMLAACGAPEDSEHESIARISEAGMANGTVPLSGHRRR